MNIKASCQYDDMKGTVAFDFIELSEKNDLNDFFQLKDEFIIGLDFYFSEYFDGKVSITAIYHESLKTFDDVEKALNNKINNGFKEIHKEININEFFKFLKRFNMKIFKKINNLENLKIIKD